MPYYCYQCEATVEADQSLQCSRCHGEFIEEVNSPLINAANAGVSAPFGRAMPPMEFLQSVLAGQPVAQPATSSRESDTQDNRPPGGLGNIGNFLSSIFRGAMGSNTESGPSTYAGQQPTQNAGQFQQGDPMFDFVNHLITNLSVNAPPGATFRIEVNPNHQPIIHGDVNNYVFGDGQFDQFISHLLNNFQQQEQGIREEDLNRLPVTEITEEQAQNELQCTTCMDAFHIGEKVGQLECRHVFHKDCIVPWLKRQRTCPICRQQIDPSKWPGSDESKTQRVIADVDELD